MTGSLVAAVDVGGTTIKGALVDASSEIVASIAAPTPTADGPEAVVHSVRRVAVDLLDRAAGQEVVAVGVAVPGIVDGPAGIARYSANIGWRDVPLRKLMATDTGLPVTLAHDVRAGALAERILGRARGADDCAVVIIGTGVAAVLFSGGEELVGAHGMAGELGHVTVHPDGDLCACGRSGCLETYASAAAVSRRYAGAGGPPRSAAEIIAAAASGVDGLAATIWRDAVGALAEGLAQLVMLIDPALIVIGGGLAEAGDTLLDPLRAAVAATLTWNESPRMERSLLGVNAGQLGAALLARRSVGDTGIGTAGIPR